MKRRALLGGIGIVALSGCVSTVKSVTDSNSAPIDNREFEVFKGGTDVFESVSSVSPDVSFRQSEKQVEITGKLCVGSGGEGKPTLEKATYHDDSHTLIVHVGREKLQNSRNLNMVIQAYRAEITFQQELPHSVVAVELGQCNVESTTAHLPADE